MSENRSFTPCEKAQLADKLTRACAGGVWAQAVTLHDIRLAIKFLREEAPSETGLIDAEFMEAMRDSRYSHEWIGMVLRSRMHNATLEAQNAAPQDSPVQGHEVGAPSIDPTRTPAVAAFSSDKECQVSRTPDEHGNPFGCEYSLRFDGDHKYYDFVTAECFHRLERELAESETRWKRAHESWHECLRRAEMAEAQLLASSARGELPTAYIEHHKGGDNLVWDDPGGKRTPLYKSHGDQGKHG